MAEWRESLNISRFPFRSSSRISTTLTEAKSPIASLCCNLASGKNLSVNLAKRYLSLLALRYDSISGEADPRITAALVIPANCIDTSRAWYLGLDSFCLYVHSCSSSITTSPRSGWGANTAPLEPITTPYSPSRIFHHWSNLSPRESPLCITAISPGNRDANLSMVWGVRAISGTRTSAFFPCSKQCWTESK